MHIRKSYSINMCFRCTDYIPYVSTLLLLCMCIVSISTQSYAGNGHFNTGQRFLPAPVYPDVEYSDTNQYTDYNAPSSQNEPLPWSIAQQPKLNIEAAINRLSNSPVWVPDWPSSSVTLGQVSAVSVDRDGRVYVFHRATHEWKRDSFLEGDRYWDINEPPIALPTILVFNGTSGQLLDQWGENIFTLPHGLTVDSKNNVWVTDVALHQVMKFSYGEKETPSITLGTRFVPGNDNHHFCKPSGVAVMESGDFFVSDGYCNTRIIKYSSTGKILTQWGRNLFRGGATVVPQPYSFSVPHALALAEDKELICVADRENGRVQCFNSVNGTFISQFHSPVIGSRLFSVAYSPVKGGQLYVVNGPEFGISSRPIRGFVIDITTRKILSQFGPNNKDFSNPHDVAVSKDGKDIYVVELNPHKVHKFVDKTIISVEKNGILNKSSPAPLVDLVANKTTLTSTLAPVKPTATVEGLSLVGSNWGGWAGVAGGVAGGLGAVLLILLGGAALLLRARHRGGTPLLPEKESLIF